MKWSQNPLANPWVEIIAITDDNIRYEMSNCFIFLIPLHCLCAIFSSRTVRREFHAFFRRALTAFRQPHDASAASNSLPRAHDCSAIATLSHLKLVPRARFRFSHHRPLPHCAIGGAAAQSNGRRAQRSALRVTAMTTARRAPSGGTTRAGMLLSLLVLLAATVPTALALSQRAGP